MALVMVRESSYEYARLRGDVFEMLSALDRGLIGKGTRVLIKPNLLAPAAPERALTTHPLVIKAAAEYALSRGGEVRVSDSPPLGSFERIIRESGVADALEGMPVGVGEFRESLAVPAGGTFKTVEVAREAVEADLIMNLAKLKTHSQMTLTLAVKNLFGCVAGMKKAEWHYRVGDNRELFAELLLSVYQSLRPSLNLLDGILAMEGDGPGTGGTPRHLGVLLGSSEALSVDTAVCRMLGLEPWRVPVLKAAGGMGLDLGFETAGALPRVRGFTLPPSSDLLFGPRFTHRFMRRHLTSRPARLEELCTYCNECINVCPAGAIERKGKRIDFDYERCIRCYCCLEVCPHGAMKKEVPFLRRVVDPFIKK